MLPSQTVENYLKTIFLAQIALGEIEGLVPMGQVATSLGVGHDRRRDVGTVAIRRLDELANQSHTTRRPDN